MGDRRLLPALLLTVALASPGAAADLRPELRVAYTGGTELAYDGRYVYAAQWNGRYRRGEAPRQGGVRILDASASPPKQVGWIACPGNDMDVAVVRPGLLAVGHHRSSCGVRGNGVTFFDVANPAKPRRLGSVAVPSSHTITAVPGTSLVYASPGGTGSAGGSTAVVDATDAARPRVVTTYAPDTWGCHDVTFADTPLNGLLGVCAGWGGVYLWDMTDPLRPRRLHTIATRDTIQFPHGAAVSPDGALLVVNDEAFFRHTCGDPDGEDGALHLYDITRPTGPRYLGRINPPRGRYDEATPFGGSDTWCTSHQLNFAPTGRTLVNAWFTGGVSVWDLTVPVAPREVAYWQPKDAVAWTGHWFADRVWVNDMNRGLEVLRLAQLPVGPVGVAPTWRAGPMVRRRPPAPPPERGRFLCPT